MNSSKGRSKEDKSKEKDESKVKREHKSKEGKKHKSKEDKKDHKSKEEKKHKSKEDKKDKSKEDKKHKSKEDKRHKSKAEKKDKSKEDRKHKSKEQPGGSKDEEFHLYLAVYTPDVGNYYHWAFAITNPARKLWYVFQVVQDKENGPFRPNSLPVDPKKSTKCHPLTFLGVMHAGWADTLAQNIEEIQVPGEAVHWNCQDYVMDIWDMMESCQMIDYDTWATGREAMIPYYGQDFGGRQDESSEEEDSDEDDDDETQGKQGHFLSEEYAYDSSTSDE